MNQQIPALQQQMLDDLNATVQMIAVLTAMKMTQTDDPDTLAMYLHIDRAGIVSQEKMKQVVLHRMPEMVREGLVDNGQLTEDAHFLLEGYNSYVRTALIVH